MSKQNQATETQQNKQRTKPEVAPVAEPVIEFAGVADIASGLTAASGNGDPVENQVAARLNNRRIPLVQRYALADQIREVQGNGHLQRLVASQPPENGGDAPTEAERPAAQPAGEARQEIAQSQTETVAAQQAGQAAQQTPPLSGSQTPVLEPEREAAASQPPLSGPSAPERTVAPSSPGNGVEPAAGGYQTAPASPQADPAFQGVVKNIKGTAQGEKAHAPAAATAGEALAAAESPASEIEAKAEANKVGEMQQAETPGFNAAAFKAQLMNSITSVAPQTPKDADEFKESGKLDGLKAEAKAKAAEEKEATKAPMEEATAKPPDTSQVEPKPVTPLAPPQPGEAPADPGAGAAAPKPKTEGEVQTPFQENSQSLDQQMAEAEVTEEQLENSNEPQFQKALADKQEAQTDAAGAPQAYRQLEQSQLAQAEGEAAAVAQQKTQAMHGDRAAVLNQVGGQQEQTKTKDEQEREKVAADIQKIYDETETNVNKILGDLDAEVDKTFDEGANTAKQAFEDYVEAEMNAYKEKRYGGPLGWTKWIEDWLGDMPEEVNVFYVKGRELFIAKMNVVIDNVVAIIGRRLAEAKAEIANGKQKIQTYLAGLDPALRQVGQQAAEEIQGKFDELEQTVDNKQNELIDHLTQKYVEKLQAVDARIEELKEANKGLISKAGDAIGGAIKTIMELKDMLMNVLSRAADAISKIIKDPIGFLGNLIEGLKQGFNNFVNNIGTHLQQGLISWLTGAITGAGITLPESFDLKGIFQLVMQILGLSFEQIMGRVAEAIGFDILPFIDPIRELIEAYQAGGLAALAERGLTNVIGEDNMAALMEVWTTIQAVMSGDFGKLWELVQEHLSDLKEMVMGKIQEFIAERVIKAGITWLLSLLTPAGAFIKACMTIYNIIMFFVERGSQIMSLVNAVIDSVSNIANGNVGGAAKFIEESLVKGIPVLISFIASLLGLGNVSDKVREIIEDARKLVDKALDKIFNSKPVQLVAGFIKKIIGKIKGFIKTGVQKVKSKLGLEKGKENSLNDPERKQEVEVGLQQLHQVEAQYAQNGGLKYTDAVKVANTVKQNNQVFQTIQVVDEGKEWVYDYVVQRMKEESNLKKVDEWIAKDVTGDPRKFSEYALVPNHPKGKDKIFLGTLGYHPRSQEDAEELLSLYIRQAKDKFAKKEYTPGEKDQHGQRFTIEIEVKGKRLKTGWILDNNGTLKLATPFTGFA